MNIEERAAQAAAWKATGQCNCAQAVLKTFEDKLPVDADTLMKLGAGYAAGMGCMESTCGALIGAARSPPKISCVPGQSAAARSRSYLLLYHPAAA